MLMIFDWDGTLIDSTGKITRCMQAAIADIGLEERADSEVKQIIGLGLPEAVRQLFPDIDSHCSDALRQAYSQHFIEADQTPCPFYPGVLDVLNVLREQGHQLSVATGKSRRGLNRVLGNLGMEDFFDATRCADETASKPHPRMLFELMEELRASAGQSLMIGDTAFDLEMAKNAGIGSVAVSYGAHDRERLRPHQPHLFIDHFPELLEWLEKVSPAGK